MQIRVNTWYLSNEGAPVFIMMSDRDSSNHRGYYLSITYNENAKGFFTYYSEGIPIVGHYNLRYHLKIKKELLNYKRVEAKLLSLTDSNRSVVFKTLYKLR